MTSPDQPKSESVSAVAQSVSWRRLGTTVATTVVLLLGWESYARTFAGVGTGARVVGHVVQDASNNDDLARTLSELPSSRVATILVLGSSQVHSVKDEEDFSPLAFPFRLRGPESPAGDELILDLSGPGQQVMESMAIQLGSRTDLGASAVVLGVGLFSMLSSDIRPALHSAVDGTLIRAELLAASQAGLSQRAQQLLLERLSLPEARGVRDSTIQERADSRLESLLGPRLAILGNRRAMKFRLIDQPIRRDAIQFIQRRRGAIRTARTYQIGEAYEVSLAAIEAMAASASLKRVPFILVLLPFDRTRSPSPYSPETAARVAADMREVSQRLGFRLLDLTSVLGPEYFGLYSDGSPDGLHFRGGGHEIVGRSVAAELAELLRTP